MRLLRPLPRLVTQPLSAALLLAWVAQMALLGHRSCVQAGPMNLAADLARYGTAAQWRGIYYRGEKIGFSVSQTSPNPEGFELLEDGRLQMSLLGATTVAKLHTRAQVDRAFDLRSFEFTLDPGTGPIGVSGRVDGRRLTLTLSTPGGATRTEQRMLDADPALALNVPRRLAGAGLVTGTRHEFAVFDPATLQNAPMVVQVGKREVVSVEDRPLPAFRVEMQFAGLRITSWVTDTGEVVREESPMGIIVVRESRGRAVSLAVPAQIQADLAEAAAVVPTSPRRIDDARAVRLLRMRIEGAELSGPDVQGVGQVVNGDIVEIRDPQGFEPGPADPEAARYLGPEPLIESDAPEIVAEAKAAVRGLSGRRERAERLTRHVNALLEKKPTVSLPSAREVLRTRVGDCNEHTALYVALARSLGIPARVAVGLTHVHGAFYYHAWPEVYLEGPAGRGLWLPVDPTLNEFPADATHLRLARGGLDKQTAILPLVGRIKMTVLDLQLAPGSTPTLVGRQPTPADRVRERFDIPLPRRQEGGGCWSSPSRAGGT
ncbi:MAG TPA: transglutaminase-like domain-containing protein [Vicinamibacteria bacterium]